MTTTFSRTVTFSVSAVSLGLPLDEASLSRLRVDGFQRLQRAAGILIEQGIHMRNAYLPGSTPISEPELVNQCVR